MDYFHPGKDLPGMDNKDIQFKNKLGDSQTFKVSRFKEKIKRTVPHKHKGYYELIFLSKGEGFHWVDDRRHKVGPPELFFLKSGSLHCWQFTTIPRGYVCMFKPGFVDELREVGLVELLAKINKRAQARVDPIEETLFEGLFDEMLRVSQEGSAQREHILLGCLRILLSRLSELRVREEAKNSTPSARQFLAFSDLLASPGGEELVRVADFANILQTSPQNLNAACRRNDGRSAGDILMSHRLLEAKRYLLHTDKTVSEIAFSLHFNDPSYFNRFFKRHTGQTPGQFRQMDFQ